MKETAMTLKLLVPALAASLLVAGCVYLPLGSLPRVITGAIANGTASVQLSTEIAAGGFRTQAVQPYLATDITVLKLELFKVSGSPATETAVNDALGNPVVLEIPQANLSQPVNFTKLHASTTYRIKAKAYADAGKTQVISVDASSSVDVAVAQEDRPTLARIKVQLIAKAFDAQGSTGIDVASGSLVPAGNETMTQ
jgi:hypothetical protein